MEKYDKILLPIIYRKNPKLIKIFLAWNRLTVTTHPEKYKVLTRGNAISGLLLETLQQETILRYLAQVLCGLTVDRPLAFVYVGLCSESVDTRDLSR